jgi:hypothetical protein
MCALHIASVEIEHGSIFGIRAPTRGDSLRIAGVLDHLDDATVGITVRITKGEDANSKVLFDDSSRLSDLVTEGAIIEFRKERVAHRVGAYLVSFLGEHAQLRPTHHAIPIRPRKPAARAFHIRDIPSAHLRWQALYAFHEVKGHKQSVLPYDSQLARRVFYSGTVTLKHALCGVGQPIVPERIVALDCGDRDEKARFEPDLAKDRSSMEEIVSLTVIERDRQKRTRRNI